MTAYADPPPVLAVIAAARAYLATCARRLVRRNPRTDAADLLAVAVAAVWEARGRVLAAADPDGFALLVGRRAMLNAVRRERRQATARTLEPAADGCDLLDTFAGRAPPPDADRFADLVAPLDPPARALLARRLGDGASLGELAAEAGVCSATVAARLRRALAALRPHLD